MRPYDSSTRVVLALLGICLLGCASARGINGGGVEDAPTLEAGPEREGRALEIPSTPGLQVFDEVRIESCYDGDTCRVTLPGLPDVFGRRLGVRLLGLDTPEIRGKCPKEKALAQEAKAELWRLVSGAKRVDLMEISRGKYFRIVARIKADGVDATDHMIAAGLAVPYWGGTKVKDWCE